MAAISTWSFYEAQLTVLTTYCIVALLLERYLSSLKKKPAHLDGKTQEDGRGLGWKQSDSGQKHAYGRLSKMYLLVYAVVMGADWLQGPYVYSLYREQYKFPEHMVALLFVTGFTSGGITAPLVGVWADQYGRRRLCLVFCTTYTLTCACTLVPSFPVLLLGRVLGGLSTSILFSCFESWLMSSSSSVGLKESELSNIMGRATLINGFVATTAGVVSNKLVAVTQNFQTPFIASGALLVLAYTIIRSSWGENFGSSGGKTDLFQIARLKTAWRIVRQDTALMVLVLTQTCFEGTMYLFVFLWVPSLQEVSPTDGEALPLGYIFSSFMVSMMLGSLIYTTIVSFPPSSGSADSFVVLHAKVSSLICIASAISLLVAVTTVDPRYRFWAFCVFEACVGMYYPVQGMLRSSIIPNEQRATLSALSRVPLNVFVTVSLLVGVSKARSLVFGSCAVLLVTSALMTAFVIVRRAEEVPASNTLKD